MAAHFYSQGVTIVTQLATLPIFLARWSADQYGEWLVLSAIPSYLAVADFGIVTAGGNMMTMHRARGETDEMNRVFHSSIAIIMVMVPLFAVGLLLPLLVFGFGLSLDKRIALSALLLSALLNVACGLFDSAYRPFGKYPKVTLLFTTGRVVDWLGTIAGLYIGGTLASAAIGMLCGRAACCAAMFLFALRDVPELQWKVEGADGKLVKQLISSGIGFLSFPISNILTLQGMVILVGAQLGGGAVAVFNTSRTLARLLSQLAILTGKSTSPEISRLYGAGKAHEGDLLVKQLLWLIVPLTIVGAIALEVLGPWVISHWSQGKLSFDRTVFTWLVVGAIFAAYWQIRSTQLTATNRHRVLATMYLVVSCTALVGVYLSQKFFGISAAAAATCLIEVAMVLCTVWTLSRLNTSSARA
jgi:O-antigen/teichoic acid export membrane protein